MKRLTLCAVLILALLTLPGCSHSSGSASSEPSAVPTDLHTQTETAPTLSAEEQILSRMTLREKVGQLFIVTPDALTADGSSPTALLDDMAENLIHYPVGGIIHFSENMVSPEQIREFNRDLQQASSVALFLCVDEEGGSVARLANSRGFDLPVFPSAGSIRNAAAARNMGSTIGAYLAEFGFNVNFAPVADVNTNPYNPVIGIRAFSADPAAAAAMASAFANGLAEHGIIATYKHFPGHGDTAQDSHLGIAVSEKSAEEMALCEWLPFMEATAGDMVMVGHIAAPQITDDMLPASLSRRLVTEILKGQLGFSGLVVTDSMQMGAITNTYSSGEAAVLALQAGCDIILMPENLAKAFDAVLAAVENGQLSEEWLDETVLRILRFKYAHGILE